MILFVSWCAMIGATFVSIFDSVPPSFTGIAPQGPATPSEPRIDVRDECLSIDRGANQLALCIPRDEELSFTVEIDAGILGDLDVGKVTLSSGAEPYVDGLPRLSTPASRVQPAEVGWIDSYASGSYLGYELRHNLNVRHQPRDWPRAFYRDTQAGSENRRRELRMGLRDDAIWAVFRSDRHCRGCKDASHMVEAPWLWSEPEHCTKCKRLEHRVWKPEKEDQSRTVPPGTVDMLSAVYLARSLVRDGSESTDILLLDRQRLWKVHLERGRRKHVTAPAGTYACVLVKLKTEVPPGEPRSDEPFSGLFGIRGSIAIWMEEHTGVPVVIEGEFPVPVVGDLSVRVALKSHRGTPREFRPVK